MILIAVGVLGCLMDSMAIVPLTVPVFYSLVQSLGFDQIWFGILVVRVTEMGLITPPVGLNVYINQVSPACPWGLFLREWSHFSSQIFWKLYF